MVRLDDKVLIVTGSTQGIGESTALLAAESGAAGIVICGRQQDKGKSVQAAIQDRDCPAVYVPADLSQVEDCRRVVKICDERFGRVDCLVNSAADTSRGTLEGTDVELWDYLFQVNARAPFILTQECVKIMRREKIAGVNAIMLGWTDTPGEDAVMRKNGFPENWLEIVEQAMPFGRLIKSIDVARMCVYLLSDESGIITGSLIDYAQRATSFVSPIKIDW